MKSPYPKFTTVSAYIASFPLSIRRILREFRSVARKSAPTAKEAIRYGMPTLRLNGNLVHFAAFKHHIGFFPTPSAIKAFKKELAPYDCDKGTIRFPLEGPIPFLLVRKIIVYRVKEVAAGKTE